MSRYAKEHRWKERAACSTALWPGAWYGETKDGKRTSLVIRKQALDVCATCPVAMMCLSESIALDERWAVRGGVDWMNPPQVYRRMRRPGRKAVA